MLKEEFLANVGTWNNHLVLLWDGLQISHDCPYPVAEFGCGDGSTPYMRKFCADAGRPFVSYENSKEWADKCGSTFIEDWRTADIYKEYSVVLIDHAPGEHRHEAVAILKDLARIIVVHDSEINGGGNYMYDKVFYLFKYRRDYNATGGGAGATILSNYYDVGGLQEEVAAKITDSIPCRLGHAINGIIPGELDVQYADQVCDCKRIVFTKVLCGCPGRQHYIINSRENI